MDTTLITLLTNAGIAGVFVVLFLTGLVFPRSVVEDLKTERDELKASVAAERERADTAVAAVQTTRDIFTALQAGAAIGEHDRRHS